MGKGELDQEYEWFSGPKLSFDDSENHFIVEKFESSKPINIQGEVFDYENKDNIDTDQMIKRILSILETDSFAWKNAKSKFYETAGTEDYFEDEYDFPDGFPTPEQLKSALVNSLPHSEEGVNSELYQQSLEKLFLEAFNKVESYTHIKSDNPHDIETIGQVTGHALYYNDALLKDLSIETAQNLLIDIHNKPGTRFYLANDLLDQYGKLFNQQSDEQMKSFTEEVLNSNPAKQLQILEVMQSTAIAAVTKYLHGNGEPGTSMSKVVELIENINSHTESKLVKLLCANWLEHGTRSFNTKDWDGWYLPSSSFGSKSHFTVTDEYSSGDDLLEFDVNFINMRLKRVAKDAVAAYYFDVPQSYSIVEDKLLETNIDRYNKSSRRNFERVYEELNEYGKYDNPGIEESYWIVRNVYSLRQAEFHKSVEECAQELAENVGIFSFNEWQDFIEDQNASSDWYDKHGFFANKEYPRPNAQQARLRILTKNYRELDGKLRHWLNKMSNELPARHHVHMRPYQEIAKDDQIPEYYLSDNSELSMAVKYLQTPVMRNTIMNDMGVDLKQISFKTQLNFLTYLSTTTEGQYDQLKNALNSHNSSELKNKILQSFLVYAENPNGVEDILILSNLEKIDGKSIEVIFTKYSEIIDAINVVEDFIMQNFSKDFDFKASDMKDIKFKLLEKANRLLYSLAKEARDSGIDQDVTIKLDSIQADIMLYATVFKNAVIKARQNNIEVKFNEIKNTRLSLESAEDLVKNQDRVKQMEQVYYANYSDKKYPEDFKNSLVKNLIPLDRVHTRFYIAEHGDDISAYSRFRDILDNSGKLSGVHFGAFNLNPKYAGGLIGEEMMMQFLAKETHKGVPIYAECDPETLIAKKYIEYGFVGTKPEIYNGIPILNIELNSTTNKKLTTKGGEYDSPDKVMLEINRLVLENNQNSIVGKIFSKGEPLNFDICNQGFLLTHFVEDKKTGDRYCLFEKPTEAVRELTAVA